jgi:thiamine pyrophosphate-dependent acetolactate synthase large subunit-like protein
MVEISVQQGMPPPNLPKIAEQLLVRGYDVMNPEELWPAIEQSIGVENPLAQELQQQIGPNGQQPGPINKQQFAQPAGNEAAQIRESVQL